MSADSVDARLHALEWKARAGAADSAAPVADAARSASAARQRPSLALPRLLAGRITDAFAGVHAYRVMLEDRVVLWCTPLVASTIGSATGPRSLVGYRPGDTVLCVVHPHEGVGWIVGAVPPALLDAARGRSDCLHQSGRCGLQVDRVHSALFRFADGSGAINHSAWRPSDDLPGMAGGWITETGLRLAVDPFLAQLAVDEATGVFAHYLDQLLQVKGVNFQESSASHEREQLVDESELLEYHGRAVYPWEAYGATAPGLELLRSYDSAATQLNEPHYSALEPTLDRQRPFHRLFALGGYLGQGGKRTLLGPPETAQLLSYEGAEAADTPPEVLPGLFHEHLSLAGGYAVQAAHSLLLVRRLGIPGPRRRRRPEDPAGDTAATYRFSGRDGDGPEHVIAAGLAVAEAEGDPAGQRAAGLLDTVSYVCNFEGVQPIHHHVGDWHVPEADEGPLPAACPVPEYERLAEEPVLTPPEPVVFTVDHRYGAVDYTPGVSVLALLQDGSIALADAYGAEIRMGGGNITIDAPGDIVLRSGRNVVSLAGRDVIARACNAADITTAQGDLRLKAERNLHVLAGNSGEGGLTLESRGAPAYDYEGQGEEVQSGGIHLKATAADVAVYAQTGVHVRAGIDEPADITLDAGKGGGQILMHADTAVRHLTTGASDYFGGYQATRAVNVYGAAGNVMGGATSLLGGLNIGGALNASSASVAGRLIVEGNTTVGGRLTARLGGTFDPAADELVRNAATGVRDAVSESRGESADALKAGKAAAELKALYDGPLADGTIQAVGFSCRTTEQYRTGSARIWEARWQQLARLAGRATAVWIEPPVPTPTGGAEGMPYPGVEVWRDLSRFCIQDLALYDAAAGTPLARAQDGYAEATLKAAEAKPADGSYPIIP